MKVNPNIIDLVVISTSYTSRILKRDLSDAYVEFNCGYSYDEQGVLRDEDGNLPPSPQEVLKKFGFLYVKDQLWGKNETIGDFTCSSDGVYVTSTDAAEVQEAQEAQSIVSLATDDEDGIVVLRGKSIGDAITAVKFLSELDYCAFFKLSTFDTFNITEVKGKKVLYMSFDTESG